MTYFAAIAEAGSIRGAAEQLGVSVPVVSEALSDLEDELKVTLAVRTTRKLELTQAGERFYVAVTNMLSAAREAMETVARDKPLSGRIAITLPVELAAHWLPERLARFQKKHPDVDFTIEASDSVTDLKGSSFDIAVRAAYVPPGAVEHGFERLPLVAVAAALPEIQRENDAMRIVGLPFLKAFGVEQVDIRYGARDKVLQVAFERAIEINNRDAAIAMARKGLGFVLVTEAAVALYLQQGGLLNILPGADFGCVVLRSLVRDRLPSPEAKAFEAFLKQPA
ncbi:LysR family transcriptional regulator [Roseibium sp. MMSF_3544]|uniref:LysR family transcriptional regulator n=1 Tax=unclassified Roseibium TaxID=2629323 RepID=UPI00273E7E25|nr:LysR family transcriptional regulator [Roseibium sp. MMSF_3544]